MITIKQLNQYWNNLSLNQKLAILRTLGIETIEIYHLSHDRYLKRPIKDCQSIQFHQLNKEQQKQVLDYVNKTPAKIAKKAKISD